MVPDSVVGEEEIGRGEEEKEEEEEVNDFDTKDCLPSRRFSWLDSVLPELALRGVETLGGLEDTAEEERGGEAELRREIQPSWSSRRVPHESSGERSSSLNCCCLYTRINSSVSQSFSPSLSPSSSLSLGILLVPGTLLVSSASSRDPCGFFDGDEDKILPSTSFSALLSRLSPSTHPLSGAPNLPTFSFLSSLSPFSSSSRSSFILFFFFSLSSCSRRVTSAISAVPSPPSSSSSLSSLELLFFFFFCSSPVTPSFSSSFRVFLFSFSSASSFLSSFTSVVSFVFSFSSSSRTEPSFLCSSVSSRGEEEEEEEEKEEKEDERVDAACLGD